VGRSAPEFQKLPSGRLRGQFWLGQHPTPEETVWHRVYSLDRHAESLRTKGLRPGMLVEVTGTLQVSEKAEQDGTIKRTESIYCFGAHVLGGEVQRSPRS